MHLDSIIAAETAMTANERALAEHLAIYGGPSVRLKYHVELAWYAERELATLRRIRDYLTFDAASLAPAVSAPTGGAQG
jgi:hypothetical protein